MNGNIEDKMSGIGILRMRAVYMGVLTIKGTTYEVANHTRAFTRIHIP